MKVLVTGGAGYIGSVVTEVLIESGASVAVLDDLSMGHRAAVHPDAAFFEATLADRAAVDRVMAEFAPEAVMHFAARSLVGESMTKPYLYLGGNVTCGLNLIESMVAHGVSRFILSSTANLFGQPERIPIDENERIAPGSPYGESKYMLERLLAWTSEIHGMRYAALRYFNAAGASETRGEDHTPETHLIPLVLQVALGQRESISIFGEDYDTRDGTCIRDYIHIVDLAQAHILALRALDGGNRIYNLGNGDGFSVKEVIATVREVTGHAIPAKAADRRAGDPPTLLADSTKIKRELQWQPAYPKLSHIIETAWTWHQAHPRGYED
ncbi:MAG: UDP-glucose 4-epimerase GalE [Nannocystaceae bacterium]|nr:UDP-glucose 4-epimerase GalE [Nannocystaceae bacterium]